MNKNIVFVFLFLSMIVVSGCTTVISNNTTTNTTVNTTVPVDIIDTKGSPVLERFAADSDTLALKNIGEYLERVGSEYTTPESGGFGILDAVKSIGGKLSATSEDRIYDESPSGSPQQIDDLKGGEIDDNELFDEYKEYFAQAMKGNGYEIDVTQRFLIKILDKDKKGILGKDLRVVDSLGNTYNLKSDSDGQLYFYPSVYLVERSQDNYKCDGKIAFYQPTPRYYAPCSLEGSDCVIDLPDIAPYPECDTVFRGYVYDKNINTCILETSVACEKPYYFDDEESCLQVCKNQPTFVYPEKFTVSVDGREYIFTDDEKVWTIETSETVNNKEDLVLDLVFTLDTTGSMSDQINKLKETIGSISEKVTSMEVKPRIRYGMVIYRDRTDPYLTRIYDFTEDLNKFKQILNTIQANGGGDYKEDVNIALADTLEHLSWSQDKNAVRISFLIADAPPHMDYGQKYDYRTAMLRSLEIGIKIYPLASSGLDNTEGEFMFRQIALITNAKYVFITNAQGGTDFHIEEELYTVNNLDDLIVNLIQEELKKIK